MKRVLLLTLLIIGGIYYYKKYLPEKKLKSELVTNARFLDDCSVEVQTTGKLHVLNTFVKTEEQKPQVLCTKTMHLAVSPSRKYVAVKDISSGKDTVIRIFSTVKNVGNTLHNLSFYGTLNVVEFLFLQNDKLVVLSGTTGDLDSFTLSVFNLEGLYSDYPKNISGRFGYFVNVDQYKKIYALPNAGDNYSSMSIMSDVEEYKKGEPKLKIFNFDKSKVLMQFDSSALEM
jgi:hypothetical protein